MDIFKPHPLSHLGEIRKKGESSREKKKIEGRGKEGRKTGKNSREKRVQKRRRRRKQTRKVRNEEWSEGEKKKGR